MTSALAAPPLPPLPPVVNTWAAPAIALSIAVAIAVLLLVLVNATRGSIRNPTDFLIAGRRIGAGQNTLAMVTAPIMYSTMFIIVGHVALSGFDAVLLLTAFTMSMLTALLIYASPLRNVGGQTMGDLFALRARERPARTASAVVTLLIYAMFMIIMLDAAGMVANRLLDIDSRMGEALVVGAVGLVAVLYVFMGGMLGVTRILVVKAVLVLAIVAVLTTLVLAKYKLNLFNLLDDAEANAVPDPRGYDLLGPGRLFGEGSDRWVHLSKVFSIAVGVAGIPYLFMRHFVATSGRDVRRSAGWASMIIVGFYVCISIIGLGAVAILGGKNIGIVPPHRDITLPKLADDLGGQWIAGALGAIALLVVGGVFAALLINVVTSVTKDINLVRGRQPDPDAELKAIRRKVAIIGIVSVIVGIAMLQELTHIFIPTSIDLGGAAVLPAIVYTLFWRRFNTAGLLWTVYGGTAVTMVMVVFSNGVSGDPAALFPDSDFKIFDIEPGLISVPVAFLLGFIGTLTSRERNDAGFAEMQVRALTGASVPARKDPPTGGADERDRESRTPSEAH